MVLHTFMRALMANVTQRGECIVVAPPAELTLARLDTRWSGFEMSVESALETDQLYVLDFYPGCHESHENIITSDELSEMAGTDIIDTLLNHVYSDHPDLESEEATVWGVADIESIAQVSGVDEIKREHPHSIASLEQFQDVMFTFVNPEILDPRTEAFYKDTALQSGELWGRGRHRVLQSRERDGRTAWDQQNH